MIAMESTVRWIFLFSLMTLGLGACSTIAGRRPIPDAMGPNALWETYKRTSIQDGRVVSWDEGGITTSEGQGYAMLRAVWSQDPATFESVWQWTKSHLQIRTDALFAWKWKDNALDQNAASDADTDIALALFLAADRFSKPAYRDEAHRILASIWDHEVVKIKDTYYLTGGNWGPDQDYPTIHVGYLAPYAYSYFASRDANHPWKALTQSTYKIWEALLQDHSKVLPPEKLFVDKQSGQLLWTQPKTGEATDFSYDVFPLYWRMAMDQRWESHAHKTMRRHFMKFFRDEWTREGKLMDHYTLTGQPSSKQEGMPLYATVHSLAMVEDSLLAEDIEARRLNGLRQNAAEGKDTPYYLANWLWFDEALQAGLTER
jgi:cellulose synthase (UDP-forming)